MLRNHLKIAFRSLSKKKLFAGLNILGLSMGLCIASLLLLYIKDELSFNKMHQNYEQIYRVIVHADFDEEQEKWANAPNVVGPAAKENIPAVKEQVRLVKHSFGDKTFINSEDRKLVETSLYWADPSIFKIFDFNILQGKESELLIEPNQVVLSEKSVKKYFGEEDPIGQSLKINNRTIVTVVGVYETLPSNSSLDAELIGSFSTNKNWTNRLVWSNSSFETFLLLEKNTNPKEVETSMAALLDENVSKDNQWFSLSLQTLEDVHLRSADITESYTSRLGDPNQLKLLLFLVIAVLLIACINYMNMSTARSQQKAKEVGINKTIGAKRGQLMQRFYAETAVLVGIAFVLSLVLIFLFLPTFNNLADKTFSFKDLMTPLFVFGSLGIAAFITLVSGAYPALYLSSFSPKSLFENSAFKQNRGTGLFRKGLVITQFIASVVIIVATLVFNEQLRFIQNKELGYQPDLTVGVMISGAEDGPQIKGFVDNLRRIPEVEHVGLAQTFPGNGGSGRGIAKPQNVEEYLPVESSRVTPEIVDLLGLNLLAGTTLPNRTISYEDSIAQVILNKKAVDFLGYTPQEAIGQEVKDFIYRKKSIVVGVVEDFHFESLYQDIGGYAFHNAATEQYEYTLTKLNTNDLASSMQKVKNTFEANIPNSAFEYIFLDEHVEELYRSEQKVARIFLVFAILTIFIACLGLFGLAAYTAERRTKEIGIRKVLGATVTGIVGLLSKDFLKLVFIAFLIASPIAWYLMQKWLQSFAYHTEIRWWIFALAGIVAISIALLTVSFQSMRAALTNPTKSLRNE